MAIPGLLTTLLDDSLLSVRFFNGRLLSGSDLTREQQSERERLRRLGKAMGVGILDGLEVGWDPAGAVLSLHPGTANSPNGDILTVSKEVSFPSSVLLSAVNSLPLKRTSGELGPCTDGSQEASGRLFVLLAVPTAIDEGRAPGAAVARAADTCGVDHGRDAVDLALSYLRLPEQLCTVPVPSLRSAIAGSLLEGTWTPSLGTNSVPLAILWANAAKILWVDPWAIRRLATPPVEEHVARFLGGWTAARGFARMLQQQQHLADMKRSPTIVERLQWLAPGGFFPEGSSEEETRRLADVLEPWLPSSSPPFPAPLQVDEGQLAEALRRSFSLPSIPVPTENSPRPALERLAGPRGLAWVRADTAQLEVTLTMTQAKVTMPDEAWEGTRLTLVGPRGETWTLSGASGVRTYRFAGLPGGEGYRLKIDNLSLQATPSLLLNLRVGHVVAVEVPVVAALYSAARTPPRWIDVTADNTTARFYLAPELGQPCLQTMQKPTRETPVRGAPAGVRVPTPSEYQPAWRSAHPVNISGYTTFGEVAPPLQEWMQRWQDYLAHNLDDNHISTSMLQPPQLLVQTSYVSKYLLNPESATSMTKTSFLVRFGNWVVPMRVVPPESRTKEPVALNSSWMPDLSESNLSALASIGVFYVDELLAVEDEELKKIVPDKRDRERLTKAAADAVKTINDRDLLTGMSWVSG